jgi:hypothetical protein
MGWHARPPSREHLLSCWQTSRERFTCRTSRYQRTVPWAGKLYERFVACVLIGVASKMLGHMTLTVASGIYGHMREGMQRETVPSGSRN